MAFWRSTWPVARKQYQCSGCGIYIQIGEYHASHAGVSDGDFYAYRLCRPCDDLIDFLHRTFDRYEEGVDLGDLLTETQEALGDEHPSYVKLRDRMEVARSTRVLDA